MREFRLKNNVSVCVKQNKNTPRAALTLNISIIKPEKFAGEYSIMNRLLLKGTKSYSSEELAALLDENAIDFSCEMKSDYLRIRFVCLNEDFEKALSIMQDIILNSTFSEFEKERVKMKGELTAELDSAKVKVSDLFTKTIYKNHYYGHSYTEVLENIDKVRNSASEIIYVDIDNLRGDTVSFFHRGECGFSSDTAHVTAAHFMHQRFGVSFKSLFGHLNESGGGAVCFKTAAPAAGAGTSAVLNDHMTELCSPIGAAGQNLTVPNDAAADTCAKRNHDRGSRALSGTGYRFSERREICVVADGDFFFGKLHIFRKESGQRKV